MFAAILALLTMPFTDLSKLRGIQFRPLSKIAFFLFLANFLILMQLGAKHVESPFIELGQICTGIYFAHFLLIVPSITYLENSLIDLATNPSDLKSKYNFMNYIGLFAFIITTILFILLITVFVLLFVLVILTIVNSLLFGQVVYAMSPSDVDDFHAHINNVIDTCENGIYSDRHSFKDLSREDRRSVTSSLRTISSTMSKYGVEAPEGFRIYFHGHIGKNVSLRHIATKVDLLRTYDDS